MQATAPPFSQAHHHSRQPATVFLVLEPFSSPVAHEAVVIRISPLDMRIALRTDPGLDLRELHSMNHGILIELPMPKPHRKAITRGKLTGVARHTDEDEPRVTLDIDFPELTTEEELALRESNPLLLV